jgi:putative addiction module component (TIGR02574 family)
MATKDMVINEALSLSEADRLDVIERLSESLSSASEITSAWDAEIDRRLDDASSGRARFSPWEEARKRIVGEENAAQT